MSSEHQEEVEELIDQAEENMTETAEEEQEAPEIRIGSKAELEEVLRAVTGSAIVNGIEVSDIEDAFDYRLNGVQYQAEEIFNRQRMAQQAAQESLNGE